MENAGSDGDGAKDASRIRFKSGEKQVRPRFVCVEFPYGLCNRYMYC